MSVQYLADFASLVDEAAENCGLDPSALTHRHLISARRSLELLFIDIETEGATPEFRLETTIASPPPGQRFIFLPPDTIDVLDVAYRYQGKDLPIGRTTRQDWIYLADKGALSFPNCYFVDKSSKSDLAAYLLPNVGGSQSGPVSSPPGWGDGGWGDAPWGDDYEGANNASTMDTVPVLVLWPGPGYEGTQIVYSRLRQHLTPSGLGDAVDASRNWLPTVIDGLSAKLAKKFAPDRYDRLLSEYQAKLAGRLQSQDRGPVTISFRAHGFSRARRH